MGCGIVALLIGAIYRALFFFFALLWAATAAPHFASSPIAALAGSVQQRRNDRIGSKVAALVLPHELGRGHCRRVGGARWSLAGEQFRCVLSITGHVGPREIATCAVRNSSQIKRGSCVRCTKEVPSVEKSSGGTAAHAFIKQPLRDRPLRGHTFAALCPSCCWRHLCMHCLQRIGLAAVAKGGREERGDERRVAAG